MPGNDVVLFAPELWASQACAVEPRNPSLESAGSRHKLHHMNMRAVLQSGMLAAFLLITGPATFAATAPEAAVKKSRAGICHLQGTAGYQQTIRFKAFASVETCLKSGGRLPKNPRKKSHFDPATPAQAGDEGVLYGSLVKVVDGDTVIVKVQGAALHFRLAGIDAPSPINPTVPAQA